MAGSRIKGITIEIDGNATGLEKSLSNVNKDLRATQSQLRDVNKLLKLDPTNMELLRQKQKLLKQAIEDTKQKLDKEKEALRQLKAADQTPEVVKQQEALERQIAEDEQALKGLKDEAKSFGSAGMAAFAAVGDKVKAVGEKIKGVGDTLTTHVTAPLVALGGASIAAFKTVDDGYDEMIKKTGATGEAAEELRGIMNSLASQIPTDFTTAGQAIGEVNTRFGVTGEELEKLSAKFIKFADLNNTDVSGSVDKVQKALAAYGLDAEAADGFLDRLSATCQTTGVSYDKLADGVVQNGAAFQELGLSIDQSVEFMGALEKSGANSETVLSGMRRALKSATKEGKPLDQALSELQQTIKNGDDSVDGLTAAYDLFGKSGDQIYAAVQNGTLDFEKLGETVGDVGGNIDSTFAETVDPIDEFKMAMNDLKVVGAELGAVLLDVLKPAIEKARDVIQQVKEKWDSLSPGVQDAIVKAGLIVAAVGPVLSILGTAITVIGALMSPLGLIVIAVGAAVAAGVALYKNWDTICQAAKTLLSDLKTTFENIKASITSIMNTIKTFISGAWNTIKTTITNALNVIRTTISNIWNTIKTIISTAVNAVKGTISRGFNAAKTAVSTAFNAVKTTISNAMGLARDKVNSIVSTIKTKLSFSGAADKAKKAFEAVKTAITDPINTAKELVETAVSTIKSKFPISMGKIFSGIKLPHFKISGGSIPWGIGGQGTKPSVSIDWYAKGAIFRQPTLIGTPNGVAGVGEAGAEAVLPLSELWTHMAEMGDQIVAGVNASNSANAGLLYNAMTEAFKQMSFSISGREFARILRDYGG